MAITTIGNVSGLSGLSGASPVEFASNPVSVTVIDGLTAVKSANINFWISGELTYTVVISNTADNPPFTGGVLTERFDDGVTLAFSPRPVTIDGLPAEYTFSDGLLTVNDIPDIYPGESVTVVFRVIQV